MINLLDICEYCEPMLVDLGIEVLHRGLTNTLGVTVIIEESSPSRL